MQRRTGQALALYLFSLLWSVSAVAADIDEVRQQLSGDIQKAQAGLSALEAEVSRERGELAARLNRIQNRVLDLRERAVAARRAADEETLSLSRIESRLESWQEQSQYQSRLLAAYLDRAGKRSLGDASEFEMVRELQMFNDLLAEQETRLYPRWQQARVVKPEGQVENASLLSLGPVHFFLQAESQQAGLIDRDDGMNRVRYLFDGAGGGGLEDLYREGKGRISFDPTLSRALMLAEDQESLLQHLQKGGVWVIPILLFALFATVIAMAKAVSLLRLPDLFPALAERVEHALKESPETATSLLEKIQGPQRELLAIALRAQTVEQRDDRLYAKLLEQRNGLEKWLGAIAMTASVSPLLGLLGTVSGMIATFKLMTLFGAGDASSVSAGISEALVTTELGLVVAIPALLAHALMSRKVKNYFARLESDAIHLSQLPAKERSA